MRLTSDAHHVPEEGFLPGALGCAFCLLGCWLPFSRRVRRAKGYALRELKCISASCWVLYFLFFS